MRLFGSVIVAGIILSAGVVFGQPAPAAAATTAPAPRYVLVMPPGFEKVTLAGHTAICQPNDVEWVKKALADVKPATRPSTMPVDLLKRATENRAAVIKQMMSDLALADDKEANRFYDEQLLVTLKKMDEIKPPVYFLVSTREKLRELSRDGWGEPRFHYNRVAEEVGFEDNLRMSIDAPMDDTILPTFYTEKDAPEARVKSLATGIQQLETSVANMVARQSLPAVFNLTAEHIGEKYFDTLKLRRDQQWLALGVTGFFTSKYAGTITTAPRDQWLKEMTFENPRYPVNSRSIDLVHPLEESAMKKAAVPYYSQAMRRKATAAVMKWAEKGGEPSITKVLVAIRAKPPADGAALVKLIQETGGVDLSKELAAQ